MATSRCLRGRRKRRSSAQAEAGERRAHDSFNRLVEGTRARSDARMPSHVLRAALWRQLAACVSLVMD